MKIGKEVEGRFLGLNTLFMQAEEFRLFRRHDLSLSPIADRLARVKGCTQTEALTRVCGLAHWYVSDHQNTLNGEEPLFEDLATAGVLTTLEITQVRLRNRPAYLTLMLAMPEETVAQFIRLRDTDQVKFSNKTSSAHEVWSIMAKQMVYTAADDFQGDIDLGRCVGLDGSHAHWEA